ncbi:splicing factor ESS-2 homolog [Watersipora subatra]|uniref:splicing factor ESS-2 homolog n=1 Tax=Watersipora subatra TaxID=2589382 RepID=UPI00355C8DE7
MMSSANEKALIPTSSSSKAVALTTGEFKVPKAKPKKILEEDAYEESIVKIIERDYYPDLPKLRAQSEYLEAKARNDTEKLREIHLKYGPRKEKPATQQADSTSDIYSTPASFDTPATTNEQLTTPGPGAEAHRKEKQPKEDVSKVEGDTSMRLDKFLSVHTSEDNESFVELMDDFEKKRKEKHAWLYVKEGEQKELEDQQLALPSVEAQAAIEGNPTKLQTWTYKPDNALMYNVEGAPLTAEEKIELASKAKEINPNATRFSSNPFKEPAIPSAPAVPVYGRPKGVIGRVDVDGKEIGPRTPNVGGYNFVATPAPEPGAHGESPIMTWGEIEGTPFLLDASDQPIKPLTPAPVFKLREEPKRDRIGRELAEKVAKQHRDKKSQAVERMKSRLTSPGLSRTERLATLSPAARRLAQTKGVHINTDKALRESYTPSPLHRPLTGVKTPLMFKSGTPKTARTPKTSIASDKRSSSSNLDLTDNLLNLPAKRKPRAEDFF